MAEPWHFEKLRLKSGLNMQVARAGVDAAKPLVVMLHGFPECWYSWRHQIRALAPHFECVAPDLRGYGDSGAPTDDVALYGTDRVTHDLWSEFLTRSRVVYLADTPRCMRPLAERPLHCA